MRTGRYRLGCWALGVAALVAARGALPSRADEPKPAEQPRPADRAAAEKSLDEKLLENLDNELLEGAGRPADAADEASKPPDAGALEGEDAGDESDEQPLSRVGRRMMSVRRAIPRVESARRTAQAQEEIVQDLAKLIEQLEKQCPGGACDKPGSSGGQKTAGRKPVSQSKPGTASGEGAAPASQAAKESSQRLRKETAQRPDASTVQSLLKNTWGNLPQRLREQMLQSPPEEFLPEFELELEQYFKRLAEQESK